MPQNLQPCIEANFYSLGESTDMAQNFHIKLSPGFDQIQVNKTNLAEDMGVKNQPYGIPPKIARNLILPPSSYGNLGESKKIRRPQKLEGQLSITR